jgi:hypothetical protein
MLALPLPAIAIRCVLLGFPFGIWDCWQQAQQDQAFPPFPLKIMHHYHYHSAIIIIIFIVINFESLISKIM